MMIDEEKHVSLEEEIFFFLFLFFFRFPSYCGTDVQFYHGKWKVFENEAGSLLPVLLTSLRSIRDNTYFILEEECKIDLEKTRYIFMLYSGTIDRWEIRFLVEFRARMADRAAFVATTIESS